MNSPWIYIVLAGIVLVVYARLLPKPEGKAASTHLQQNLEEAIELFAAEIEQENKELVALISNMRKQHEEHAARMGQRIDMLEKKLTEIDSNRQLAPKSSPQHLHRTAQSEMAAAGAAKSAEKPTAVGSQTKIRSRYSELFEMHESGKSIDYIAKKMNMNRGEISLIMQLARQEDRLDG